MELKFEVFGFENGNNEFIDFIYEELDNLNININGVNFIASNSEYIKNAIVVRILKMEYASVEKYISVVNSIVGIITSNGMRCE